MTNRKSNKPLPVIKGKEIVGQITDKLQMWFLVWLTALSLIGTIIGCGPSREERERDPENPKCKKELLDEKNQSYESEYDDYRTSMEDRKKDPESPEHKKELLDEKSQPYEAEKPFDAKSEVEDLSKIQKNIQEFWVEAGKKLWKFSPWEKIMAEHIDGKEVVEVSLGARELWDKHRNSADRRVTTTNITNDINISIKDSGRTTKVRLCRRRQVVWRKLMLHMGFLVTVDGVQICDEVINVDNGEKFKDSETNKSYQYMKWLASKVVQLRGYIIHKECQKHKSELDQIRLKEDSIKIKEDSIQNAKLAKEKAAREYLNRVVKE